MKKHFNTTGPCLPDRHYMLPARQRCAGMMPLIEAGEYFVLHAARQSGKTTVLFDVVNELNASGRFRAVYCSLETLKTVRDERQGIPAILDRLLYSIKNEPGVRKSFDIRHDPLRWATALQETLSAVCSQLDRPLVLLFDEADCLSNGTLVCFLRQLRNGYVERNRAPYPVSVALVGMRNIRDYKGRIREDSATLGSSSPFNVVKESLTLGSFTRDETAALYRQHTEAAGQAFSPAAVDRAFYWSQGQPWLVNAIAREAVEKILRNDASKPVEADHIEDAVQTIILRRDTHIDSLLERLKEDRVRRIVEPMVTGERGEFSYLDDDVAYCTDLGLVVNREGVITPSNPLYAEVIGRTLSYDSQMRLSPELGGKFMTASGIDMDALLKAFQDFWRENSEIWKRFAFAYQEAAPHLVLMAFLQRVLNGGGRVVREMALGSLRLDLCVEFAGSRYPVEVKVRRSEKTAAEGVEQTTKYLERLGCDEGWLVMFDPRPGVSWDEKIYFRAEKASGGSTVRLFGC